MEPLVPILFWLRGIMLITVMAVSVGCIVIGAFIFLKQSAALLGVQESVDAKMGPNEASASFKSATGLSLVLIGLVSAHATLRTKIDVSAEWSGAYGLSAMLPSLFTAAVAAEQNDQKSLPDFCKFTLDRAVTKIRIRGADGSTLSLNRERLLHALNQAVREDEAARTPQTAALVGTTILSDGALTRHLRYVLVQTAVPKDATVVVCTQLGAGTLASDDPMAARIRELLDEE